MTYKFNGFKADLGNTLKKFDYKEGIYDAMIWISKDFEPEKYVLDIKPYQTDPVKHCQGIGKHNEIIYQSNSGILTINESHAILSIQKRNFNDTPEPVIRGFEKILQENSQKSKNKKVLTTTF